MSAVTAAGFASPTLGLRTSTMLKDSVGRAMRAQPRNTTLSSSSSSLSRHRSNEECQAHYSTHLACAADLL